MNEDKIPQGMPKDVAEKLGLLDDSKDAELKRLGTLVHGLIKTEKPLQRAFIAMLVLGEVIEDIMAINPESTMIVKKLVSDSIGKAIVRAGIKEMAARFGVDPEQLRGGDDDDDQG